MAFGGTYYRRFTIYPTEFETIRGVERINPFPTKGINIFSFNAPAQNHYPGEMYQCIPYEQIPFIRESIIKLWYDKYVEVSMGTAFLAVPILFFVLLPERFQVCFFDDCDDTKRAHLKA